jgi:hypothetical protein
MGPNQYKLRVARALIVAAALLLAVPGPAVAAPPNRPRSAAAVVGRSAVSAQQAYWTARRMQEAIPRRLAVPGGSRPLARPTPDGPAGWVAGRAPATSSRALAPKSIPYSSGFVSTPSAYPFSANGKLFFTDPETTLNYVCSGTVVSAASKSLVWTAGHCVHPGDGSASWYTNVMFVPGYDNGAAPLGQWFATESFSTAGWTQSGDFSFDMGAITVAPDAQGRFIEDVTGSRGIAWNLPPEQHWQAFGYPAAAPFSGGRQYMCDSDFGGFDPQPATIPVPIAIGCNMTGGSSGGGWIVEDTYLNSVNSFGYSTQPNVLYGPYFGDAAAELYSAVGGGIEPPPEPEPVSHAVTVTLVLRKHLVAKGTVGVTDGFTECASNAEVNLQRRRPWGWKTVAAISAGREGAYSVRIKDRPGRYRTVVERRTVGDLDVCESATSPVVKSR